MPDHYDFTDAVDLLIEDLIENDPDHQDLRLAGVTVGVLFFTGNGPLKCKGWPCYAYVKKTSLRDRAMGVRDAVIVIDKEKWEEFEEHHQREIIDHELWHLMVSSDGTRVEGEGDDAKVVPNYEFDTLHRPKLILRKHDIELGIFLRDAKKHGSRSLLRQEMVALADKHGQLLFGFGETADLDLKGEEFGKAAARKFSETVRKGGATVTVEHEGKVIFETGK